MLDDFVGDMGHRGTRWFAGVVVTKVNVLSNLCQYRQPMLGFPAPELSLIKGTHGSGSSAAGSRQYWS
jgi:hypothetical protein